MTFWLLLSLSHSHIPTSFTNTYVDTYIHTTYKHTTYKHTTYMHTTYINILLTLHTTYIKYYIHYKLHTYILHTYYIHNTTYILRTLMYLRQVLCVCLFHLIQFSFVLSLSLLISRSSSFYSNLCLILHTSNWPQGVMRTNVQTKERGRGFSSNVVVDQFSHLVLYIHACIRLSIGTHLCDVA